MIRVIPTGGLCDRMSTIECFLSYQQSLSLKQIKIIWNLDEDLNCKFEDLFEPIPDFVIVNKKKVRNKLLKKLRNTFYRFTNKEKIDLYKINRSDLELYLKNKTNLLLTGFIFDESREKRYFDRFIVKEKIMKKIPEFFSNNTIGVHLRRTDNINAIKNSPSELFYERIKLEIENNKNVKFYCSSDSEDEIIKLTKHFPNRIIYQENCVRTRNSTDGINSAVVDLYSLAMCHKILGSDWSAFSWMASKINDIPLERIKL